MRRRSWRSSRAETVSRLWPSSEIAPESGSMRRSSRRATVLFPDPDSPTMPSVWPRSMWNVTSSATVLGNFAQTKFADHASSATFFRDRGKFMVRTEGPDRARHDYQIKYTFGVSPLQQYLIELPGGRL